ncbi:MAG: aldehyde dehydrogenase family protein [Rhodospirillales bacterium]|nr:aldehyde dehydrogenase family protein [Rhodospirillales bacterium]
MDIRPLLDALGVDPTAGLAGALSVRSPIDGSELGRMAAASEGDVGAAVADAEAAFLAWRHVPAPRRGDLVRLFADVLRANKEALAALVTIECGKIGAEAQGEVQEMIDICDFAVGLSRQLYGLTMATERPDHRLMETWHPLGPIGVITAFNFPVAVWAWNFALAIVCGDPVVWKPSEKTPFAAVACAALFAQAVRRWSGEAPAGLLRLVMGGSGPGALLARDPRLKLISATGSCAMGRAVAPVVAARFGRLLLELGGNNAMVVAPSADLDLAVRAIVFSAVGTAGQRCTTLRRLIVHESIADDVVRRLRLAYAGLAVGDPRADGTVVGPLIDARARTAMERALAQARSDGGLVFGGDPVALDEAPHGVYVSPALVEMPAQTDIVRAETFAPILYVLRYRDFTDAVRLHNEVDQGLASSIFTADVREAERFLSAAGSDCGIVNVNIGPSGAEIGGAFGGEKATGGGREAGSDAWRAYMRRATNTINYSRDLPLAQGIVFAGGA